MKKYLAIGIIDETNHTIKVLKYGLLTEELVDPEYANSLSQDEKVKATGNDTNPGNLSEKIIAGENISLNLLNTGQNEVYQVASQSKVRVTSGSSDIPKYLEEKIVAGDNIEIEKVDGMGDKVLRINATLEATVLLSLGWEFEDPLSAIRTDETLFDISSDYIEYGNPTNAISHVLFMEDTLPTKGPLGTLQSIGSINEMTVTKWGKINGLLFSVSAMQGSWFNVLNEAAAPDDNHKGILTGTGANVNFLERATFAYDHTLNKWCLISYEKHRWHKTFSIGNPTAANQDVVIGHFPTRGFYHIHAFVGVSETLIGNPANLLASQVLTIKSSSSSKVVDSSVYHVPVDSIPTKVVGTSLGGSCILQETAEGCNHRELIINVTLPNGDTQSVTGGYVDVEFISDEEGYNC